MRDGAHAAAKTLLHCGAGAIGRARVGVRCALLEEDAAGVVDGWLSETKIGGKPVVAVAGDDGAAVGEERHRALEAQHRDVDQLDAVASGEVGNRFAA